MNFNPNFFTCNLSIFFFLCVPFPKRINNLEFVNNVFLILENVLKSLN